MVVIEIIVATIVILGLVAGLCFVLNETDVLARLPKIRRVKVVEQTPEQVKAFEEEMVRSTSKRTRALEEKRAEERLEERHQDRARDLQEFEYQMEALMPHSEHETKTRLSPRTGCYVCEQERKQDIARWRTMIEGI